MNFADIFELALEKTAALDKARDAYLDAVIQSVIPDEIAYGDEDLKNGLRKLVEHEVRGMEKDLTDATIEAMTKMLMGDMDK